MQFCSNSLPTGIDNMPPVQTDQLALFVPEIIAVLKANELICHHDDEELNEDEAAEFTSAVLRHPTDRYAVRHNLELTYRESSVRVYIHMAVSGDCQAWIDEIQAYPHPQVNPDFDYAKLNADFEKLLFG